VHSSNDLPRIITGIRPGTKVTLTVWRKGATKDIAVTVAEMKEDVAMAQQRRGPPPKEKAKPNRMGLVLSDLTDEQRKELDLKNGGVLVEDVVGVVRGNVQPGDVILAIIQRGAPIEAKSAAQVNEHLAKLDKGAAVTLQIRRGDNAFYATLKLGNGEG
jgi:serine protease Do